MQPHKLIIGIITVTLFITAGLFVMFGSSADTADSLFDEYEDISANIASINRSKFGNIDDEQGGEATLAGVYNISKVQEGDLDEEIDKTTQWRIIDIGPVKALRRMKEYYNLIGIITQDIAKTLHIPTIFIEFTNVVIFIIVAFTLVYMFMKFQPRND